MGLLGFMGLNSRNLEIREFQKTDSISELTQLIRSAYKQLAAAKRKKSFAETIGLLIHQGISDLRANPSARL